LPIRFRRYRSRGIAAQAAATIFRETILSVIFFLSSWAVASSGGAFLYASAVVDGFIVTQNKHRVVKERSSGDAEPDYWSATKNAGVDPLMF